jgi:hypothetical protein
MVQMNPEVTIPEAFGEGPVFQCKGRNCNKSFKTERNLNNRYSHDHPEVKRNKSVIPYQRLYQFLISQRRQEERTEDSELTEEAVQQSPHEEKEMVQLRQEKERRREGEKAQELSEPDALAKTTPTRSRQIRIGI